jgi:hypothetical protein
VLESSSFVVNLFPSLLFYLLCVVPQYGRLAAILVLLALNHYACLRNARRISYKSDQCGLSLHRNERKQTAKKTKSRRPTSLHLTCMIVVGGVKQGSARVRFLSVCFVFVTMLFLSVCMLYLCSSVWSFGSHFTLAGV